MSWITKEQIDHGVQMWATLFKEMGKAAAGMAVRAKDATVAAAHRVGTGLKDTMQGFNPKASPPQTSEKVVPERERALERQAADDKAVAKATEEFLGKGGALKAYPVQDISVMSANGQSQQMAALSATLNDMGQKKASADLQEVLAVNAVLNDIGTQQSAVGDAGATHGLNPKARPSIAGKSRSDFALGA